VLRPIAEVFNPQDYPNLLVGLNDADDAAVWKLSDDQALVATTDFFTPVVDNPYDYGAIAAANALSDVYAMGGTPFLALNVAALPPDLPTVMLSEILRGGAEKAREAGVVIAGGHTIQDAEPKFGLIVLGFVNPTSMITKNGAVPGDKLVLSKPLGFGVTTTALKQGKASDEDVAEVVRWMKVLNKNASELAKAHGVRGGTDITGFSLLGHAWEVAEASNVGLRIYFDQVPFTQGSKEYAKQYLFPGGSSDNRLFYGKHVRFDSRIDESAQLSLFDSQTSGGLLLSVPAENVDALFEHAEREHQPLWLIGDVFQGDHIEVVIKSRGS
jgi:selenide,water dikinase